MMRTQGAAGGLNCAKGVPQGTQGAAGRRQRRPTRVKQSLVVGDCGIRPRSCEGPMASLSVPTMIVLLEASCKAQHRGVGVIISWGSAGLVPYLRHSLLRSP